MNEESVLYTVFLIFTGGAVIATLALYARQSVLIAYIALGLLAGPHALGFISDPTLIDDIATVGIIFLLFLLGLNLEPDELIKLLREATVVTFLSSLTFGLFGFVVAMSFNFNPTDSAVIAAAMMFSSTIIGLKLLPTSALHHQRMGEIIISILLLQDIIAVTVLLLVEGLGTQGSSPALKILSMLVLLPVISIAAYWISKHVLSYLFQKFDQINEYIFLLTVGWCMGLAELAHAVGLSHEVGAFIAGVSLAANPIARYIAESLKPLRDFFLVMFFFGLGAGFDISSVHLVLFPALVLAITLIFLKPFIFSLLLRREHEKKKIATEVGVRLGQISEFSLLVAVVALSAGVISERASLLVQTATIISFLISSFWIVRHYPTPIATDEKLRRD